MLICIIWYYIWYDMIRSFDWHPGIAFLTQSVVEKKKLSVRIQLEHLSIFVTHVLTAWRTREAVSNDQRRKTPRPLIPVETIDQANINKPSTPTPVSLRRLCTNTDYRKTKRGNGWNPLAFKPALKTACALLGHQRRQFQCAMAALIQWSSFSAAAAVRDCTDHWSLSSTLLWVLRTWSELVPVLWLGAPGSSTTAHPPLIAWLLRPIP